MHLQAKLWEILLKDSGYCGQQTGQTALCWPHVSATSHTDSTVFAVTSVVLSVALNSSIQQRRKISVQIQVRHCVFLYSMD
jgi:hypothetical protein